MDTEFEQILAEVLLNAIEVGKVTTTYNVLDVMLKTGIVSSSEYLADKSDLDIEKVRTTFLLKLSCARLRAYADSLGME